MRLLQSSLLLCAATAACLFAQTSIQGRDRRQRRRQAVHDFSLRQRCQQAVPGAAAVGVGQDRDPRLPDGKHSGREPRPPAPPRPLVFLRRRQRRQVLGERSFVHQGPHRQDRGTESRTEAQRQGPGDDRDDELGRSGRQGAAGGEPQDDLLFRPEDANHRLRYHAHVRGGRHASATPRKARSPSGWPSRLRSERARRSWMPTAAPP